VLHTELTGKSMKKPSHFKALFETDRPVKELLDTHAEMRMLHAVQETANRFGVSEAEVLKALRNDTFLVKAKR